MRMVVQRHVLRLGEGGPHRITAAGYILRIPVSHRWAGGHSHALPLGGEAGILQSLPLLGRAGVNLSSPSVDEDAAVLHRLICILGVASGPARENECRRRQNNASECLAHGLSSTEGSALVGGSTRRRWMPRKRRSLQSNRGRGRGP